jgi:anti-sigma factor RsiW
VLGVWVWFGGLSSRSGASLADHLVSDFEHFVANGRRVQTESSDPEAVSHWLRGKTDVPIRLAAAAPTGWRLLGGRKCEIAGKPAAFAAFERDADRAAASVVGIAASAEALEGMEVVREGDETHWAMRCRGHTVLACERAGVIYAVVSRLPHDDLAALMQNGGPNSKD